MRSAQDPAVLETTRVRVPILPATSKNLVERTKSCQLVVECVRDELTWYRLAASIAIALSAAKRALMSLWTPF